MRVFDLSFRYKVPLWGSVLIAVGALTVSLFFLAQTHENLRRDMLANSESLGRVLVRTVYPALMHDDVWRAFEIVNAATGDRRQGLTGLIVLDAKHQVFVSTRPDDWPLLAPANRLGAAFAALDRQLVATAGLRPVTVEADRLILLAVPMVADGVDLGHLVLVHPADFYWPRFQALAWRALLITLLILAVLVPINWYWARRMAEPLVTLAAGMDDLARRPCEAPLASEAPLPSAYRYHDELGHLFQAYGRMQAELTEKAALERNMVKADRLAALGRLATGIAHEINNPLGGLITVLDTIKHHARPDPVLAQSLPLLERGLGQIRDIVAALLVEAKARSRPLNGHDIDDVRTLLAQSARKQDIDCQWDNRIEGEVPLPSTLVRQVLINLVLNALQAAGPAGQVSVLCARGDGHLALSVENTGPAIHESLMEHLFEPYTGLNEDGHGLGLWVTHQIVEQLGGRIAVDRRDERTRFSVELPEGEHAWPTPASA